MKTDLPVADADDGFGGNQETALCMDAGDIVDPGVRVFDVRPARRRGA
jgi:hypothetical protein